ncbi:hypothetical protein FHS83_001153 [Rhizomicrobium palustre]|jgi:hypothetical protein|uniref:Uncharacterized protein n=1 Tax=Rhizomicrobium palustre TaxID=189966 RepID=A0A846MX81_9PROT|nr:hypothetical protein [Rhizomicrobium palustre]
MRAPSNACCVGGPDREMQPLAGRVVLAIASIYGAIAFFAYAVMVLHP